MGGTVRAARTRDMLLVEDERVVALGFKELFTSAGYAVRIASSGRTALAEFKKKLPCVVLLDIMLPDGDGYDVCRKMRKIDEFVPIVFSTALDSPRDVERGLEVGGDDYIPKTAPDQIRLARVARAAERYEAFRARRTGDVEGRKIAIGTARVDTAELTIEGGRKRGEKLTRTEADILSFLDSDRARIFSVDDIVDAVRGEGFVCNENTIYVHISRIKAKLGKAASHLVNVKKTGYALRP